MEINFNPGRVSDSGTNQPIARGRSTPSTSEATGLPHERTQALEQSLRDASQVRPEVVERAKALVNDPQYPSDKDLDHISTLMALHLKP